MSPLKAEIITSFVIKISLSSNVFYLISAISPLDLSLLLHRPWISDSSATSFNLNCTNSAHQLESRWLRPLEIPTLRSVGPHLFTRSAFYFRIVCGPSTHWIFHEFSTTHRPPACEIARLPTLFLSPFTFSALCLRLPSPYA